MKILCVHGLGDHRNTPWHQSWRNAIDEVLPDPSSAEYAFGTYDPIFEKVHLSFGETTRALLKLSWSGISSLLTRTRGLERGLSHALRWQAGYVVAWAEDEAFKQETRRWLLDLLREEEPDMLLAHSLGSLISYNALSHADAHQGDLPDLLERMTYVTLGSQIGNGFVRTCLTPGRIAPLDVGRWIHLFNPNDHVFTAPVRLFDAPNFTQIDTPFDIPGDVLNHAAPAYLAHPSTAEAVWARLTPGDEAMSPARRIGDALPAQKRPPRQRAILVGINEYPNPDERLAGCVNDVFLVSALLQESGFRPEDIRVLLDERATARAIHERLEWLMDDPRPEDNLFFFYSGHGARIPAYGYTDEPDHMDEVLVPVDFDWTPEHAVRDKEIFELYSQLPLDTRLVMMFDCCHSGSMHRDGAPRARGITPPDDIRHRSMWWDVHEQMWRARDFKPLTPGFSDEDKVMEDYFGKDRSTLRLGRGGMARALNKKEYDELRQGRGPVGPYLPVIIEACREEELSFEYRHGVTSYGAFTYTLAQCLRRAGETGITYQALVDQAGEKLAAMNYDQHPQILGPGVRLDQAVPWGT